MVVSNLNYNNIIIIKADQRLPTMLIDALEKAAFTSSSVEDTKGSIGELVGAVVVGDTVG